MMLLSMYLFMRYNEQVTNINPLCSILYTFADGKSDFI